MKKVLTEIQDGTFASEFLTEMNPNGGRKTQLPGRAPHAVRAPDREGRRRAAQDDELAQEIKRFGLYFRV